MSWEKRAERFCKLFSGYEDYHGRYTVRFQNDHGKVEGKAATVAGELTPDIAAEHLKGTGAGVGCIPLRRDNSVYWGAIDIDDRNLDHEEFGKKIARFPVVHCRSKSGGAHVYLFLNEPAPAALILEKLQDWAAFLGYGTVEIFPKQTYRQSMIDKGNWINLPYFDAEKTTRYALLENNKLSIDEFLDFAEKKQVSIAELEKFKLDSEDKVEELFLDGPPCLQNILRLGGFPEGTRNNGLFNVAVYLRKKYPDNWEDRLMNYNMVMCDPNVTINEVNEIIKSAKKKDYNYTCKQPPIQSYCNRRQCLKQSCGVRSGGSSGEIIVEITSITKFEGSPTLWIVEIEGVRILCDTETLYSQSAFNKLCMEKVNRVPGTLPKAKWERYLDEKVKSADIQSPPEDASPEGQFKMLLDQFCFGSVQAATKEELLINKPFRENGRIYFRSRALIEYLEIHRFRYKSEHHIWQILRDMDVAKEFMKFKGGRGCNIWSIPDLVEHHQMNYQQPNYNSVSF